MAVTNSIQANLRPLLCFLNNNSSSIYCVTSMSLDTLGLLFGGLTACQQYLKYIKVSFHGIIFPNGLLKG